GEPKEPNGSALFGIYPAFASAEETADMRKAYADGIAWGDAKQALFERIDSEVAPLRERYEGLIANPARIEQQLRDGARRLRERHATPFLRELRHAVGLRDLSTATAGDAQAARSPKTVLPTFKQYRESDGRFHFKLVEGDRLLLVSRGFDSPKDAGQRVAALKRDGFAGAGDDVVLGEGVAGDDVARALDALRAAEEAKA